MLSEHAAMARKKSLARYFAPWVNKLLRKRERFESVRLRDGDICWRCTRLMRFGPPYNVGKGATIEHIMPLSKGGTWALDNLRLCHVGCNRHLADHDPAQKERMRTGRARQAT